MSELERYPHEATKFAPDAEWTRWTPALQAAWDLKEAVEWIENNAPIVEYRDDARGRWMWTVAIYNQGDDDWACATTLPEAVAALKAKLGGSRG